MLPSPTPIDPDRIPCPFRYANDKACPGHVVGVEAYKADLEWSLDESGQWSFGFAPRSHYHLFCSEKGNHAGFKRQDDPQMKLHWRELPGDIRNLLERTAPGAAEGKRPATP